MIKKSRYDREVRNILGLMLVMVRYVFLFFLVGAIGIFGSCTKYTRIRPAEKINLPAYVDNNTASKAYGAYLAGRVAHIRRDFGKASDYYIETLKNNPDNTALISRLYLILVSQGRVDEAAYYAKKVVESDRSDNFAWTVIAIEQMNKGEYKQALNTLSKYDNQAYRNFIAPMLKAWCYVGLNQREQALKQLVGLRKEAGFKGIYHSHVGMINDYFGKTEEAQKNYEVLFQDETVDMSLRSLQLISNFYLRNGQKDKAVEIFSSINNESAISEILKSLNREIRTADPQTTKPLITSPNIGVAEALFSIAATFRYDDVLDIAHMYISLAIYENPDYDLAKLLLANILEDREMYADANKIYDSIEEDSHAYYAAQLKMANNLIKQDDIDGAELLLKSLAMDYDSAQIFLDLGDILRLKNRPQEAIKYYKQAIKRTNNPSNLWILYYALGVSYDQNDDWEEAEEALKKSLKLGNEHYQILNYLGYSWISRGQNIDQAFEMIVRAYLQAPDDANINDSLGWALYNMGYYAMAVPYLEKAAEGSPTNAVISDHLGDVYWFARRKNEARFQWKHALRLKDDSKEFNPDKIHQKLEKGLNKEPFLDYDKEHIEKQIRLLSGKKRVTAQR